jgi:hypothetical protein
MKTEKPNRKQAEKRVEKSASKETRDIPNIKELLLNGPKFDLIIPKRRKWRSRAPVIFD